MSELLTWDQRPMTPLSKEEALALLQSMEHSHGDIETTHLEADDILLSYINDAEITAAFRAIPKWYA